MRYLLLLMLISGIARSQPSDSGGAKAPGWAKDAIWYQIFPERFRNGDPSNDPTAFDVGVPEGRPWSLSPWTSDWYKLQPWERERNGDFYRIVFDRYYGGDLQGVLEKLDYLDSLGITAIYFNPVFEAHSLHKYDVSSYHHIDDNFGPDPGGDRALVVNETSDPGSWRWTSADRLFLRLVSEAHARNIHIIIDGVFNHSGTRFWAFRDIRKNQQNSPYHTWYDVRSWDDPSTEKNEFEYKAWWGHKSLPEFAEGDSGFVPGVWRHFFNITRRWMDPNGDGNPSDGIDGWRLDVANEVSPVFWKVWRRYVKDLNPNAYIVGEIWDDATAWLSGEQFDAVMNYPFARACVRFFIDTDDRSIDADAFDRELQHIRESYQEETNLVLQNLLDSHDTDRLVSMIMNPNRSYDDRNGPRSNPSYNTRRPAAKHRDTQKLIALFQMTYLGAPMIYYGTEAGMWGADDPDDRKPMVWADLTYEPERTSYDQNVYAAGDPVSFDTTLHAWYTKIISLRQSSRALRRGKFSRLIADGDLYVFARFTDRDTVLVAINRGTEALDVEIPLGGEWTDWLEGRAYDLDEPIRLSSHSGQVLMRSVPPTD